MNELLRKLKEAGKTEAFDSLGSFKAAAADLGYSASDVDAYLSAQGGFPIDDDFLMSVSGGTGAVENIALNSPLIPVE